MWGTPYNSHDTLVTNHHDGLIETIDVLLYPHECAAVIERADEHGWKRSAPSGGGHGRTGREDPRTNYFSVFSDDALAAVLWSRVKPHLKEDLAHIPFNTYLSTKTRGAEWRPVGVVEKMRIYRYEPGQQFPEHVDYKTGRNIVRGGKVRCGVTMACACLWCAVRLKCYHGRLSADLNHRSIDSRVS